MSKSLVIVESPAKAKTIGRYLGDDFVVKASLGHIKDLPKSKLGIQVDDGFQLEYKIIAGKEKVLRELKSAAKKAAVIYLAADPDREGEAICFHLANELESPGKLFHRILLNEITRSSVQKAIQNPSSIDDHLVNAQQARRALDRLVGYKVSPLLWKKVRQGLSAGRVQSVALRLIVDREQEIQAFQPQEYWKLSARLSAGRPPEFEARAVRLHGEKFQINNGTLAQEVLSQVKDTDFVVDSVVTREKKRYPVPPFITSKLQQEASRRLHFPVKRTMMLAQQLYEGVELGSEGAVGLITYMRTDSPRVSQEALQEVRQYITDKHGAPYLPENAIFYKSKQGAQDAHEAIRPTSVLRTPESVKDFLDKDQFRLYDLIWKRFVASQMNPALFDETVVDIQAGPCGFRVSGAVPRFSGFIAVYEESQEEGETAEKESEEEGGSLKLPVLQPGDKLELLELVPEQKFTQPPSRFSEAMLVKALEEKGIGRPSTYASILSVLTNREYATKKEGRFVPTETGTVVVELLVESFQDLFDYEYTARMEDHLDRIETGEENWIDAMKTFYRHFNETLETAATQMRNLKQEEIPTEEVCDRCGSPMVIKWGRFGRFLACKGYPECVNTRQIKPPGSETEAGASNGFEDEVCENCGRAMVMKKGRFGEFLACSGYPECKTTRRIVKNGQEMVASKPVRKLDEPCPLCGNPLAIKNGRYGEFTACSNYPKCRYIRAKTIGMRCPKPNCEGEIHERKSRRGRIFYGCSRYPDCDFTSWQRPIAESCPECGSSYLLIKHTKRKGWQKYCPSAECDFQMETEAPNGQETSNGEASEEKPQTGTSS